MDHKLSDLIDWEISTDPVAYPAALERMSTRAAAIAQGQTRELVWLLEHPDIYTAGTSANPAELLDPRFPVFDAGRGGRYTYHGPGQRIGYLMLDLGKRGRDVRHFVHSLEDWLIAALARLGVCAFTVPERVGIWTRDGGAEAKIGALGVRVKRWVTLHGFAVNIAPELANFGGIVPCGLPQYPVTSMRDLRKNSDFASFDSALAAEFDEFLTRLGRLGQNEA
ncbi:MAG: lipoyl(octanoyl) transferase LipB [Sphingomonas sp.]